MSGREREGGRDGEREGERQWEGREREMERERDQKSVCVFESFCLTYGLHAFIFNTHSYSLSFKLKSDQLCVS